MLPAGHEVITKLPLRVYTPIPDLKYNETEAEDIREIPQFMNVNMGAVGGLSAMSCQTHEPHESLRCVPWFKLPYTETVGEGEEAVSTRSDPGVFWFQNGIWRNAIPAFDELAAMETEIHASINPAIQGDLTDVQGFATATDGLLTDTIGIYNNIVTARNSSRASDIRTKQFAVNQNWMFGTTQVTIPGGTGLYDPTNRPNGHIQIDLIDDPNDTDPWQTEGMKIVSNVYRAYNHPWATIGAGWNPVHLPWLQNVQPWPANMSYRMSRLSWNRWRASGQWYRQTLNLPELPYPEYGSNDSAYDAGYLRGLWARDFGYRCNVVDSVADPVIFITIIGDTKPGNYCDVYAEPWIEMTSALYWSPLIQYVRGFTLWFSNFKPNGESPTDDGVVDSADRTITFMWTAYGHRKTPPEIWT